MAQQAQDTFVGVLGDGSERTVTRGDVLADSHELVKRDLAASKDNPGRSPLFRPLDIDGDEPAAKASKAKAAE
jgi:hypothetical protein